MTEQKSCRSCGARIYWLKHEATGKVAPIDAESRDGGNVAIDLEHGTYRIVPVITGQRAHTSHFMTCPQQASWRNQGRKGVA